MFSFHSNDDVKWGEWLSRITPNIFIEFENEIRLIELNKFIELVVVDSSTVYF